MPPPSILPPELLERIFDFLDIHDVFADHRYQTCIYQCTFVSRLWRAVALPLLWTRIVFRCDQVSGKQQMPNRYHLLATSLADEHARASPDHVNRASHIRELCLTIWGSTTKCNMHENTISIVRILSLLSPTQLRRLSVRFDHCSSDDRQSTSKVMEALFPVLVQGLESLCFFDRTFPTSDGALMLCNLPHTLRWLSLTGKYRLEEEEKGRTPVAPYNDALVLPRLRECILCNVNIAASQLKRGIQSWDQDFRRLLIQDCPNLLLTSLIISLATNYPNLRSLKLIMSLASAWLGSTPDITDLVIIHLLDSCAHLEELHLWNAAELTNLSLGYCASRAGPQLQVFRVWQRRGQLTGAGVVDMDGWSGVRLLSVVCDEVEKMDPGFVEAVREQCGALKEYRIGRLYG